jgi:hypothetical protein
MSLQNRNTLKNFFRKGQMPSESNFMDLIDSMINKVDDGMSKNIDDGLTLSPIGTSKKLMSFFKSIEDKNPAWSIEIDNSALHIISNTQKGPLEIVTLKDGGNVGINNPDPQYALDVNGTLGIKERVGTHQQGKVLADGKWHKIMEGLNGCYAFEIIAGVGKKRTGKYALIHALALSTFGRSSNRIQINQAYYGTRCNKIDLRWTGDTYNLNLEMRTRCSYDGEYFINYNITNLWSDPAMEGSLEIGEQ